MISGITKTYAVIGSPIAHSKSPLMYNTCFQLHGVDAVYLAYDVSKEQVPEIMVGIRAMGFAGLNVTMPCKQAVIPFLDELSYVAKLTGAVNTIVREGDKLIGHNTDGVGMTNALRAKGAEIIDSHILIFGAGGAAAAIAAQCVLENAREITIVNRNMDKAVALAKTLSEDDGIRVIDLSDTKALNTEIKNSDILINATAVGMAPMADDCILKDFSALNPNMFVADAVYHPVKTRLLVQAEQRGCVTIPGMDMLIHQGAAAYKLYTGLEMPIDRIKRILEDTL